MDWMNELNWFAIQTKPYREDSAAAHVAKLDIQVFLPRIRQEQNVCGVPRTVCKALFPGYFFAHFRPLVSFDAARYTPGVLRVLGTRTSPTPVTPEIIADIKSRVQADGFVQLQSQHFARGTTVIINQGPIAGLMGRVEREWNDGRRVMILLEELHQARVLLEKRCLQSC